MPAPVTIDPAEFGLVGFVLILMWKVLEVGKTLFLAHKVPEKAVDFKMACQQDPLHFQRIKEIHDYTESVQMKIAEGQFGCQWRDREEVRDYIEIVKSQVTALTSVVEELKLLRQELVITRNGRDGGNT